MFSVPEYSPNMSQRLSRVLDDIGVNERIVLKRRKANILNEINDSLTNAMLQDEDTSTYWLGSRTEGTTTPGLQSDVDILTCMRDYNVLQDLEELQPDCTNLLIVNTESMSPGYCYLQVIQDESSTPVEDLSNDNFITDVHGRAFLKNTKVNAPVDLVCEYLQDMHGPSLALGLEGTCDMDLVFAFPCSSWPQSAVNLSESRQWPTVEMQVYAESSGCLLVPVGSNIGENTELEWRISTCLAERCMMFNLNITQIRCYVLMKMLLKTYINQKDEDYISSFMCKTILLHLARNLRSNIWQENNLFKCLSIYISVLQNCISNGQCPHFFIPENNLMGRKFSVEIKLILTERVQQLIYSYGQALLGIEIDELGQRILSSVNSLHRIEQTVAPNGKSKEVIAGSLSRDVLDRVNESHLQTLAQLHKLDFSDVFAITSLLHCISKLTVCNKQANSLEKLAVRLLVPLLYSTLGSVIASCNIGFDRCVPEGALALFLAGIRSDILSGWLKLASALYCSGEYEKTEIILRIIGGQPEIDSAQVICGCYNPGDPAIYAELARVSNERNEEAARQAITICIKFLPSEMNCVPHELLYEMFRSTEEDIQNRSDFEIWMDWAVVDCVSYLYFLQYKTYGHLRKRAEQQRALRNLAKTIDADFRLRHRETALNLLGQCLEHEGRGTHALQCYMRSINIRERNNAARMHICMLLSNLINRN